jgi:hypothetical protein
VKLRPLRVICQPRAKQRLPPRSTSDGRPGEKAGRSRIRRFSLQEAGATTVPGNLKFQDFRFEKGAEWQTIDAVVVLERLNRLTGPALRWVMLSSGHSAAFVSYNLSTFTKEQLPSGAFPTDPGFKAPCKDCAESKD